MKFELLPEITEGEFLSNTFPSEIGEIYFDSRQILKNNQKSEVFIAISGEHHDGNDFIENAFSKGIRQFIIERLFSDQKILSVSNVYLVSNAIDTLQKLAIYHRKEIDFPVIGITGSNGKTIVKEWLSLLLGSRFNIVKSPASYNSQLGVALSILKMDNSNEFGIFESGISTINEMDKLREMIQPSIGIFTNIGPAHADGFQNLQEKIKEKLKLFLDCNTLIFNDANDTVVELIESQPWRSKINLIKWGENAPVKISFDGTDATILFNNSGYTFNTPFTDPASQENLSHCIVVLLQLGFSADEIQSGIRLLRTIPMRLSVKKGINGSILVDDSYNNDPVGLSMALKFVNNQNIEGPLILIISDIIESKKVGKELYKEVSEIIEFNRVSEVFTVGNDSSALKNLLSVPVHSFSETSQLLMNLPEISPGSRVIVKGARPFRLEKVVEMLSEKLHATRLELNMTNLVHNLNVYRSLLHKNTKIMVMVKALAYGSNSVEIARILEYHGVDFLGVAYVDEGIELRKNGLQLPIMVMNPTVSSFPKMIEYNLEPEIYNFQLLNAYSYLADGDSVPGIHLKIDTGMHRLGFHPEEVNEIISLLKKSNLRLASIFSHLASSEDQKHHSFTKSQIKLFKEIASKIESETSHSLNHILNSSGIVNYPEAQMDMVRLGIGIHGYDPTGLISTRLLPVSKLVSTVSQITDVGENESIGYGRHSTTKKPSKIATIAIGYADGFRRILGNGNGEIWINHQKLKTIGNICMDMIMTDATNTDVQEGDEVEIFGVHIPIDEFAQRSKTIPYEILTSISSRVERVFLYE